MRQEAKHARNRAGMRPFRLRILRSELDKNGVMQGSFDDELRSAPRVSDGAAMAQLGIIPWKLMRLGAADIPCLREEWVKLRANLSSARHTAT